MRAKFLALSILFFTLLTAMQTVYAQSADEAAVAQAVESLRKAAMAKDRAQFDALLSEQLSYGHSAGRIETKKQFIDVATASKTVYKSMTLADHNNKVTGNNAIVRHILTIEGENEGKAYTTKIGVLMVWQKEQGAWRLLARQAYRI
ncbi:MAG TPA: nuclear transport factor 2 family protein [Burkholderiales bacterium]|nr:nuclear transport factor 2 family protein [Burkholderiales bacterium]